jgi:glucose-1-phosphate cytidylyltransferase
MKVAILAGGLGTRFAEQTRERPKAMIEIGGQPILWHIMKYFGAHGMSDFIIALGYKKELIVDYFLTLHLRQGNLAVRTRDGSVRLEGDGGPDWMVRLVDTGPMTMTGGRIKRLAPYVGNEPFLLTWCDGLADIDLDALVSFHRSHGKLATVTTVHPPSRFGYMQLDGARVTGFTEKPSIAEGWINAAYFVLEPGALDYIEGDETVWEREPLERLAADGQFVAYRHGSFWQCMDTIQEQQLLERLWNAGKAPWKIWE